MNLKQTLIALYTLIRREMIRLCRIWIQAFLGPITSIFLYFLIFGNIIGQRIGAINDIPYLQFITPGLILIAVINTSYSHVTASFFIVRFQRNIEEMLVTPMSNTVLLLGFVCSGVIRGFLVATMITAIISLLFQVHIHFNIPILLDILMTASLFSLIGFINGLYARDFDEIAFIPSFILTPLSYLGGVFYSISMLPSPWQTISKYNPLVYIIQMFRAHALNLDNQLATKTTICLALLIVVFFMLNLRLMRRGMLLKH